MCFVLLLWTNTVVKKYFELCLYALFLLSDYINHLFFNTTAVVFLWASRVGVHICLKMIHLHKHKTAFPNKINKTNYISSPVHHLLPRAQNMQCTEKHPYVFCMAEDIWIHVGLLVSEPISTEKHLAVVSPWFLWHLTQTWLYKSMLRISIIHTYYTTILIQMQV